MKALIVRMSKSNLGWGSPRIVRELQKLGNQVAKSTVEKFRARGCKLASPTWKAVIDNRLKDLVPIDFFTVPTVRFKVLFVLIVLARHRCKVRDRSKSVTIAAPWSPWLIPSSCKDGKASHSALTNYTLNRGSAYYLGTSTIN